MSSGLLGAGAIVAACTLAVKLVAMVKEMLVAAMFGTSVVLDAYLLAYALVAFLVNVFGGSLQSALVPVLVQARAAEGDSTAQDVFRGTVTLAAVLLCGMALLLATLASPLMRAFGESLPARGAELAAAMLVLMLPAIPLAGLVYVLMAGLNSMERFTLAALIPAATPVAVLAAVVCAGDSLGGRALVAGTVIGAALELVALTWALARHGLVPWPVWPVATPRLAQVTGQYLPLIGGSCLMSAAPIIDQFMAAALGAGAVSALAYGNKIVSVVLSVVSGALGTVALPVFSRIAAAAGPDELLDTLAYYRRRILLVSVPISAAIVAGSGPLVWLLFERGAFTAADTARVSALQAMLALQIPFTLMGILNVRAVSALGRNHVLLIGAAVNVLANIAGNIVFSRYMGVAGIALSTSVVACLSDRFVYVYLQRQRGAAREQVSA